MADLARRSVLMPSAELDLASESGESTHELRTRASSP
jgi:hypothetical protein